MDIGLCEPRPPCICRWTIRNMIKSTSLASQICLKPYAQSGSASLFPLENPHVLPSPLYISKRAPSLPIMIQLPLPQWCVSHAKTSATVLKFPSRVLLSFQTTFFIFYFYFFEHNLTSCPHTRYTIFFHLPKPRLLNLLPIIILLTPPTWKWHWNNEQCT